MKLLSLSADEGKVRVDAERILANARLALGAGGLLAVWFDPAEPAHFAPDAYTALVVHLVASSAIALALRSRTTLGAHGSRLLYAFDLVTAGVLTAFTDGFNSPLFVFVWFAMIAAAFRSGLPGPFFSGGIVTVVLAAEAVLAARTGTAVSLDVLIVRATYLAVMAFVLGYLAQKDRDLRREAVAIARILARARAGRTFSEGLEAAIDEVAMLCEASSAVLAITNRDGSRHCWMFRRAEPNGPLVAELTGVTAVEERTYFWEMPPEAHAWCCRRGVDNAPPETIAVDADGNRVRVTITPPAAFWDAVVGNHALGAVESYGDWHVRLYLLGVTSRLTPPTQVHLLHVIAQQVGPALVNMYLLRAQAGAAERARLARELHDRVVQSLIGLEMQAAAIERHVAPNDAFAERFHGMRAALRAEIDNVRDLMHELRPVRVSGDDLPLFLADVVERFQHHTDIRAGFTSNGVQVAATPRQCGGLVRIVQEALVNVRKHSGARHVTVQLSADHDALRLVVEDDGRGFPFAGRMDQEQLWAEHKGPLVIKERARAIGASLTIESTPGEGARVEVVIPNAVKPNSHRRR